MNASSLVRFDPQLLDGQLVLVEDHRQGLWAYDLALNGYKTRWTAGIMPSQSSAHTLLTAALISGLGSITMSQARESVVKSNGQSAKPRIEVVTRDETFGDALRSLMNRQDGPTLRSQKSLLTPLARMLAKFTVTFIHDSENRRLLTLRNWARTAVFTPSRASSLAAVAASIFGKS